MKSVYKSVMCFLMFLLTSTFLLASNDDVPVLSLYKMQVGHIPPQEEVRKMIKEFKEHFEGLHDFEINVENVSWKIDNVIWHSQAQNFYEDLEKYPLVYKGNGPYLPVLVSVLEGEKKTLSFHLFKKQSK